MIEVCCNEVSVDAGVTEEADVKYGGVFTVTVNDQTPKCRIVTDVVTVEVFISEDGRKVTMIYDGEVAGEVNICE